MNFEIVKLPELSGNQASVYSVFVEEYGITLFERFLEENAVKHPMEIQNLLDRIEIIATETGAREQFFKQNEGKPGDLVCALYDSPEHKLRLYCIRFGMDLVLLGGGGEKPKGIRAWQEDEKLTEEAEWMIKISKYIYQRRLEGDIKFANEGKDIEGDLTFVDNE